MAGLPRLLVAMVIHAMKGLQEDHEQALKAFKEPKTGRKSLTS